MKGTWRRLAAMLLCLSLSLTMLPAQAAASPSDEPDGGYETLEPDDGGMPEDGDGMGPEADAPEDEEIAESGEETGSPQAEGAEKTASPQVDGETTYPITGNCGLTNAADLNWSLGADGTLTISGTGEMKDYKNIRDGSGSTDAPWWTYAGQILKVVVADGVSTIGEYAFGRLPNLTAAEIPASVTVISTGAFLVASALKDITITDGEMPLTIENSAFSSCSSLETVSLPGRVVSIGRTFAECTALTSVTLPETVMTGHTFSLSNGTFYNCTNLQTINLPEGTKSIPEGVFNGCTSLKELAIPASVTSITDRAFKNLNLESVTFKGTGITNIPLEAFYNCTKLASVNIPEGVTRIGQDAFRSCSSLSTVTWPSTLVSIGKEAFRGCAALSSVVLPDSRENFSIEEGAFQSCKKLTSIKIPAGTTSIPTSAFFGCTALETVQIPDSVTSIGSYAFKMTPNQETGVFGKLAEITLPDSVQSIGNSAFSGTAITSLTLPRGLQSVSASFQMMPKLDELVIQEGPTEIKAYIFGSSCPVTKIHIPESVTTIDENAFVGVTGDFVIYGQPGSAAETFASAHKIPFNGQITTGRRFSVKVTDENGTEISSGYTVTWYDAGGSSLGTGTISATDDPPASFAVTLGETLRKQYQQPQRQTVTPPDDGDYVGQVVLTPLSDRTVTGRVLLPDGTTPAAGAAVTFIQDSQMAAAVITDGSGNFSATVKAGLATLTISLSGCYDRMISIGDGGDALDLGDIRLAALPQSRVELTLTAAGLGTASDMALTSFQGLTFTVIKNGQQVRGVAAQYPYLLFEDGSGLQAGDSLTITADDASGETRAQPVTVTLDGSRRGEAAIRFTRNGTFAVTLSGVSQSTVMLFDGAGKLLQAVNAAGQYTGPNLPDGGYQIAVIRRTELLKGVPTLSGLADLGLRQGADYAVRSFTVSHGQITELGTLAVPNLDESRLYYTDGSRTGTSLSSTTVPVAKLVTMRVEYALKPEYATASGQTVTVELPAGFEIAGQPTLDGQAVGNYSKDGTTVRIPTNQSSGIVRFCLTAGEAGQYHIPARLSFADGGTERVQPVGSARLTVTEAEIYAVDRVGTRNAAVSGSAAPGSTVTVYDNGQMVGSTTANDAGSWQLRYILPGSGNYELHTVYAEISNAAAGSTARTQNVEMVYDAAHRGVSRVTMYNTTHDAQRETVFDYHNPHSGLGYYILEDKNFTFKIEFDDGGAKLSNVRLDVFTEDGEVYTYDTVEVEDGVYTASASGIVPVNVGVEYACEAPDGFNYSVLETAEGKKEAKGYLSKAGEAAADLLEVKEVEGDGGETAVIRMGLAGSDENQFDVVITELDYADYPQEELTRRKFFQKDSQYVLTILGEDALEYIIVDTQEKAAVSIRVALDLNVPSEPETQQQELLSAASAGQRVGNMTFNQRLTIDLCEKMPLPLLPEFTAMMDYRYLSDLLETRHTDLLKGIDDLQRRLDMWKEARCEDGSRQLPDYIIKSIQDNIDFLRQREGIRYRDWKFKLDVVYRQRILNSFIMDGLTLGVGKLIEKIPVRDLTKLSGKALAALKVGNEMGTWEGLANYVDAVVDGWSAGQGYEVSNTTGFWDLTDIDGSPYYLSIQEAYDNLVYGQIGLSWINTALTGDIARSKCPEPTEPLPEDLYDWPKSPVKDKDVVHDPSGYVYEAVPSNRLEGVTVTISKQNESGAWDAAKYDQVNPVTTAADGLYRWDVPQGNWQVKCEKAGYTTVTTDWLPVPPPQTDINIAMVSTAAPTVSSAVAYEEQAEVAFSQYMDIGSVKSALTLVGVTDVEVEPLNAEYDLEGTVQYATRFAVKPADGSRLTAPVTVIVGAGAKNYNQTAMGTAYASEEMAPIRKPAGITAPGSVQAALGEPAAVSVTLAPGLAGRTLKIENLTPALLAASPLEVTTGADGTASFTVTGQLPGAGKIRVTDPASGLSAAIAVNVAMPARSDDTVQPVTARLADGTAVTSGMTLPYGTQIYLSTSTPGAAIRYTLNDTCPCTEDALTYSGPITVTRDLVLRAAAEKDGQYSASPNLRLELRVSSSGGSDAGHPGGIDFGFPGGNGSGAQPGKRPGGSEDTQPDEPAEKPAALPFTDIPSGAWYRDAAEYVYRKGMMAGDGSLDRFNPEGVMTRAMVVTILHRLEGEPKIQAAAFIDVAAGQWYTEAIAWASAGGIVSGYGSGAFGPNDPITREQLTAILYRYAAGKGYDITARADLSGYSDAGQISAYAAEPMSWANALGLITGMDDGTLAPRAGATRAQTAAILMRFCQGLAGQSGE